MLILMSERHIPNNIKFSSNDLDVLGSYNSGCPCFWKIKLYVVRGKFHTVRLVYGHCNGTI